MIRHIFSPIFLILILWTGPASANSAPPTTSDLLDAAFESGYSEGNMERVLEVLESALEQDPDNMDVQDFLARAWLTVGRADHAAPFIAKCVDAMPRNAGCRFTEVLAAHMTMGDDAALVLAQKIAAERPDFDRGMTTPFHLSYADLLWRAGDLAGVEAAIIAAYPQLAELAELAHLAPEDLAEGRRVPLHPAITLAHVYEATGRPVLAAGLRAHAAVVHANLLRRYEAGDTLAGFQLWNLAATGAGVEEDETVLDHLREAVQAGFVMDWRYNIANHPVFWPLRTHAGFQAIIESLERRMQSVTRD